MQLFRNVVFVDGKVPISHFVQAFERLVGGQRSRREFLPETSTKRTVFSRFDRLA